MRSKRFDCFWINIKFLDIKYQIKEGKTCFEIALNNRAFRVTAGAVRVSGTPFEKIKVYYPGTGYCAVLLAIC